MSTLVAHTSEQWRTALFQLAPTGPAWNVDDPNSIKFQTIHALADTFARWDTAVINLLNERSPATTTQLITEWETDFGLPDPCITGDLTITERRRILQAKVVRKDALTISFLEQLASFLGNDVDIIESGILQLTIFAGPTVIASEFTVLSGCNEPLRTFGDEVLECTLRGAAMAGVELIFIFNDIVEPDDVSQTSTIDQVTFS